MGITTNPPLTLYGFRWYGRINNLHCYLSQKNGKIKIIKVSDEDIKTGEVRLMIRKGRGREL